MQFRAYMLSVPNISVSQVHIQQIGQRELKRAPAVTQRFAAIKKKEKEYMEHYNIKAHL